LFVKPGSKKLVNPFTGEKVVEYISKADRIKTVQELTGASTNIAPATSVSPVSIDMSKKRPPLPYSETIEYKRGGVIKAQSGLAGFPSLQDAYDDMAAKHGLHIGMDETLPAITVTATRSRKKPNMAIDDSKTVADANAWIDNFAKSLGIGQAPTVKETQTALKDAFGITPRVKRSPLLPDLSKKYGHLQLSAADAIKQYKGNSTKKDTDVGAAPTESNLPLELGLRAGKLFTTISKNNKAHEEYQDALRDSASAALQQGPIEVYDNFSASPLYHAQLNAANNQRAMQFTGSD
jgi:hypothetical protein